MTKPTLWIFIPALAWLSIVASLRAQVTPVEVPVRDYGAIPNDNLNDIPAIRAAINALPASDSVLVFENGTYDLMPVTTLGAPTTNTSVIFDVVGKTALTICGNGATLLCHEFTPFRPFNASYFNLFSVRNCTDIEIQDLTINMSRLPYTIGSCTQINGAPTALASRSFRVTVDPSFVPSGGNLLQMKIHALVNWRNGNPNGQEFFHVAQNSNGADLSVIPSTQTACYDIHGSIALGSSGLPMMTNLLTPPATRYGRLQVGDDVVFAHQFSNYITFHFIDCTRSFLTNVTVHSWPGTAVNMLRDQDVVLDGLQVVPDPARPWPVSVTSDAVHLEYISGTIQVQGGTLEGMLDDGFNCFANVLRPYAKQSQSNTVLEVNARFPNWTYVAGTVWEFYDANMLPLGTRSTVSLSTNLSAPPRHKLVFASLPAPLSSIAYVCNLSQFPVIDVSGLTVMGNRGNGLVLRRDTSVSSCDFDRVSGHALDIGPSVVFWDEGPGGGNILVESSTFRSCARGWGLGEYGEGTISIRMETKSGGFWHTGPYGAIAGITLRSLTFTGSGGSAISVRSADQVTIDQCSFGSCGDLGLWLPLYTGPSRGRFAAESLLYSDQAGNIQITNNQVISGSTILNGDRFKTIFGTYIKSNNVGF